MTTLLLSCTLVNLFIPLAYALNFPTFLVRKTTKSRVVCQYNSRLLWRQIVLPIGTPWWIQGSSISWPFCHYLGQPPEPPGIRGDPPSLSGVPVRTCGDVDLLGLRVISRSGSDPEYKPIRDLLPSRPVLGIYEHLQADETLIRFIRIRIHVFFTFTSRVKYPPVGRELQLSCATILL